MSTTENWGQEVGVETFWMSHLSDTCFDYNPLRIATHTIYHLVKMFVRYSPKIEPDQSYTLENQVAMCRELAAKDGVLIDEKHIYQDHHISGVSDNRPQFEQILENIWSGHFPD